MTGASSGLSRRKTGLALGATVAIIVGMVVSLSGGRRHTPPKLPSPNGYDDLVRAGMLISAPWPGQGDLKKATLPEIRSFVEANRAALEQARIGLGRECMVPLDNSQEGLARHVEALSPLRSVGRLLIGEAMVAEADARFADAARSDLDALRLGRAATRGGLAIDQMVGNAIDWLAIIELRKIRDRIPADKVPAILRELDDLDHQRIPLQEILDREQAWYRGAYNPISRALMDLHGLQKTGQAAAEKAMIAGNQRVERDLRFLKAALAIHAYHEDRKAWPRSVADLVPAYLPAVPIDPRTNQPIAYPANKDGELTDDLDSIAQADGAVKPGP